ncbi:MAG: hypothetical protein Q4Q22_05330 [Methanosphaera sp.]|nr:hypothetical protein [Methanosphaera sp.]
MNDLIFTYIVNVLKILLVIIAMTYYLGLNNKINITKLTNKFHIENDMLKTFLSKVI